MLLKPLTELNGVSGDEGRIRDFIKEQAAPYCDNMMVDSMGNLMAFKAAVPGSGHVLGREGDLPFRVMLSAHMDEVGFMVVGHNEDGSLRFRSVGGVNERILPGLRVTIGKAGIPGVIGVKPIHLQEPDENKKNIKIKNLYVDIGSESKKESEELAPVGETISFHSSYVEFGDGCIKAKALDDRAGCALLLHALKGNYSFDLAVCFTVQEEVGLRGSEVAAYAVQPDIALVLEGTTCSDVPDVDEGEFSSSLGEGAVLTILDKTAYGDKSLLRYIADYATRHRIRFQYKKTTTGGNDAGKIQRSRTGVKVASISVPCRYIHSPVSMLSRKDFDAVENLLTGVLEEWSRDGAVLKALIKGGEQNG